MKKSLMKKKEEIEQFQSNYRRLLREIYGIEDSIQLRNAYRQGMLTDIFEGVERTLINRYDGKNGPSKKELKLLYEKYKSCYIDDTYGKPEAFFESELLFNPINENSDWYSGCYFCLRYEARSIVYSILKIERNNHVVLIDNVSSQNLDVIHSKLETTVLSSEHTDYSSVVGDVSCCIYRGHIEYHEDFHTCVVTTISPKKQRSLNDYLIQIRDITKGVPNLKTTIALLIKREDDSFPMYRWALSRMQIFDDENIQQFLQNKLFVSKGLSSQDDHEFYDEACSNFPSILDGN